MRTMWRKKPPKSFSRLKAEQLSQRSQTLTQRAELLDTNEIIDAIDLSLSALCRYVPIYRQTKDIDCLSEIKLSTESVFVMTNELLSRHSAVSEVTPARQLRRI